MRLVNYLNESILKTFDDFDIAMDFVTKNCKPFLNDWKLSYGFLYRGMQKYKNAPDAFVKSVRKDRDTMNMSGRLHKEIDQYFFDKFGIRGRSNAIFCSGEEYDVELYGPAHIIFPVGRYKILWSPEVKDLYIKIHLNTMYETLATYKIGDIKEAIRSGNEIMIHCKSYIAFDSNVYKHKIKNYFK